MLHRAPPAMRMLRQRGEVPGPRSHATPAGASPPPECSSFIALECCPGPNWSYHLVSGPRSNLGTGTSLEDVAQRIHFLFHDHLHFP